MARMVHCIKLNQELEGLDKAPIPGEIGKRVYEQVSKQAWKMFEEHFKMVMNEYRLNLMDPRTDEIFKQQVQQFLFSGTAARPEGFVEPTS
ncbi:oxidative damage protection protein [bacterium]|nr:oxidative damage protection protein [bacterium]HMV27132.1 oxidative damage protection protein [bacterium]HMW32493.1 oxidative damage protection protein [bacterium]HMW35256.1 oxidative damage protection protein [bacterium]HMY37443.1 oxidative damage protection protein [bacterium]